MSCNKVLSQLSAFVDGEMSGVEMQQFRSHISQCSDCRDEFDRIRGVQAVLRDLPQTPEPSPFLVEKIQKRIHDSRPNYLRLALIVAVPALCGVVFMTLHKGQQVAQNRDAILNQKVAKDQIFDAGSDPAIGGSFVHYTSFESH